MSKPQFGVAVYYGGEEKPPLPEMWPWMKERRDAIRVIWDQLILQNAQDIVLIDKEPNPDSLDPLAKYGSVGAKFNRQFKDTITFNMKGGS